MKNTIKMSLVAALAVAGLTSTASAKDLAEAIKGVQVSGQFQIDLENNLDTESTVEYDLDVTLKAPVNDQVTAVLGLQADHEADVQKTETTGRGKDNTVDDSELDISVMYFQYANAGATVLAGKQNIGTPFFDDAKADGVTVLYSTGPVTLAAAHRVNMRGADGVVTGDTDLTAFAAIGAFGPVNASIWYATSENVGGGVEVDAYTIAADTKIEMISVAARYSNVDYGTVGDAELGKIIVGADIDMASVHAGYAWTGDQAGLGASMEDGDAETDFYLEQMSLDSLVDADAFLIGAGMSMDAMSFGIDYAWAEDKADNDYSELLVSAGYDWGKNLDIDLYYSDYEEANTDKDRINLEIEYKF